MNIDFMEVCDCEFICFLKEFKIKKKKIKIK